MNCNNLFPGREWSTALKYTSGSNNLRLLFDSMKIVFMFNL